MIIAHNLTFDLGILKHDYKIANLPFPLHGKIQICTMKLSTAWCRLPKLNNTTGFKWPSLDELHYRLFGEGFDGAHDALADTHACRRCYFELVRLEVITPPNRPEGTTKPATINDHNFKEGLQYVYRDIEMPSMHVLYTMERNGVLLDCDLLKIQSRELGEKLLALEVRAHEAAGQPFNLNSTKHIQEILFDKLGLPVKKKTPGGDPSTDEEVLQELALDYPLPK